MHPREAVHVGQEFLLVPVTISAKFMRGEDTKKGPA
jgi:hypothetical protein